jgi:hypothetical protein
LKSSVIDEKTADRVTNMLNEEKREKKVYEQQEFDHEDVADIRSRESQAI